MKGGVELARNEVGELSLAEVSERYGEGGLRERLDRRLGEIGITGHDYELIEQGTELGLQLHADSKPRTYEPYVNHILRVPLRIIEQLGVSDPEVITGGILHDTVEMHARQVVEYTREEAPDTASEEVLQHLAVGALSRYMTPTVSRYVAEVTAPPRLVGDNRIRTYRDYTWAALFAGLPGSAAVKTADFIDNAIPPPSGESPVKRARLDAKQIGVYNFHLASIDRPDGLLPEENRIAIHYLLEAAKAQARSRLSQENK